MSRLLQSLDGDVSLYAYSHFSRFFVDGKNYFSLKVGLALIPFFQRGFFLIGNKDKN